MGVALSSKRVMHCHVSNRKGRSPTGHTERRTRCHLELHPRSDMCASPGFSKQGPSVPLLCRPLSAMEKAEGGSICPSSEGSEAERASWFARRPICFVGGQGLELQIRGSQAGTFWNPPEERGIKGQAVTHLSVDGKYSSNGDQAVDVGRPIQWVKADHIFPLHAERRTTSDQHSPRKRHGGQMTQHQKAMESKGKF